MSKVALITGGSSGLGLEMARQLHKKNYDLVLLARDETKLIQTKQSLERNNPDNPVHIFACDVSDQEGMIRVFEQVRSVIDNIDFLIVNAGIATIDQLVDYTTLKEVTHNLEVNLVGAISTTYLYTPMLTQSAHLLFVSSGFGLVGPAGYSLYAASKGGLNNFAEAIRRELLGRDISVHLTCPGDIDTPMYARELTHMPSWIKEKMGRAKPMPVDHAAGYILEKCFKRKFMIIPSSDVRALILMQKLLPRRVSTFLIDRILPLPPT